MFVKMHTNTHKNVLLINQMRFQHFVTHQKNNSSQLVRKPLHVRGDSGVSDINLHDQVNKAS